MIDTIIAAIDADRLVVLATIALGAAYALFELFIL